MKQNQNGSSFVHPTLAPKYHQQNMQTNEFTMRGKSPSYVVDHTISILLSEVSKSIKLSEKTKAHSVNQVLKPFISGQIFGAPQLDIVKSVKLPNGLAEPNAPEICEGSAKAKRICDAQQMKKIGLKFQPTLPADLRPRGKNRNATDRTYLNPAQKREYSTRKQYDQYSGKKELSKDRVSSNIVFPNLEQNLPSQLSRRNGLVKLEGECNNNEEDPVIKVLWQRKIGLIHSKKQRMSLCQSPENIASVLGQMTMNNLPDQTEQINYRKHSRLSNSNCNNYEQCYEHSKDEKISYNIYSFDKENSQDKQILKQKDSVIAGPCPPKLEVYSRIKAITKRKSTRLTEIKKEEETSREKGSRNYLPIIEQKSPTQRRSIKLSNDVRRWENRNGMKAQNKLEEQLRHAWAKSPKMSIKNARDTLVNHM